MAVREVAETVGSPRMRCRWDVFEGVFGGRGSCSNPGFRGGSGDLRFPMPISRGNNRRSHGGMPIGSSLRDGSRSNGVQVIIPALPIDRIVFRPRGGQSEHQSPPREWIYVGLYVGPACIGYEVAECWRGGLVDASGRCCASANWRCRWGEGGPGRILQRGARSADRCRAGQRVFFKRGALAGAIYRQCLGLSRSSSEMRRLRA